ncbi:BTB/POZ domain-containing protein At1g21780 [Amaranthus tricolor]|uniref:BTB/POZ domain-containing protein At1g21780 n=1 Tax=Amaranthus tricolor TaxID=29722 RepID=UPI00258492D9|nr:BTB/POZ domain-containing protein At1g21780 [Amaranthus tricolor]
MYESALGLSSALQQSVREKMGDTKVETISRLAQWKIDNFGPCSYKKSDSFKLGLWNWHIAIEKNRYLNVRLFPEPSRQSKDQPPLARFILRVSNLGISRRPYISPVHERLLRNSDDFVWPVDTTFYGRFVIDVEFLDLKTCPLNGGQAISIWPAQANMQSLATQSALQTLSHMLDDGIHTDVTITTADGSLKAHKAVLVACSPVFQSMFLHDLKEKESSNIEIDDMSLESCMALLRYIYGSIKPEDFWKHRLALLAAANKYNMIDLKAACEESLLEDINTGNVLERLQEAWLYSLHKLKKGCLTYLFDFGKIYDIEDEVSNFFQTADRELLTEMFHEVLTVWKPT